MLLALDPGMNSPGVALFDGGLKFADRIRVPDYTHTPPGARWLLVAQQIVDALLRRGEDDLVTTIVFECPQWYQRSKSKGDPNQLVGVAGVAASVVGMLHRNNPQVLSPTPAEWIGQLPKVCPACAGRKTAKNDYGKRVKRVCPECRGSAWETPRGRFIRSRLTLEELALAPDQNDAIDAVGLGLWALERLKPRQVFSNGRDGR